MSLQLKRLIPIGFFCALTLSVSTTASAQEDNVSKAVAMSKEAASLYRSGDYLMAAEKFRQAYELYPDPTLLKNQTVAYYKGDACPTALRSAELYRQAVQGKTDVSASDTNDVNEITAECEYRAAKAHLAADDLEKAERSIADARAVDPKPEVAAKLDGLQAEIDERRTTASDGTKGDDRLTPQPADSGTSTLAIIGWTATGVGVAALTGAVINQALVAGNINDISGCQSNPGGCSQSDIDDWQTEVDSFNSVSVPLYIGGGVLTAAGVGMLIYHYTSGSDSEVTLVPTIGKDSAGAQLMLRF